MRYKAWSFEIIRKRAYNSIPKSVSKIEKIRYDAKYASFFRKSSQVVNQQNNAWVINIGFPLFIALKVYKSFQVVRCENACK